MIYDLVTPLQAIYPNWRGFNVSKSYVIDVIAEQSKCARALPCVISTLAGAQLVPNATSLALHMSHEVARVKRRANQREA